MIMTTRISNLAGVPQSQQTPSTHRSNTPQSGFGAVLQKEWEQAQSSSIAFSKHAMTRAQERGIEVTPTLMDQLSNSVERAQAKGATNILAFDATRAFIINVPHGRVITTMSQEEMEENIFTNIDSAVLLK